MRGVEADVTLTDPVPWGTMGSNPAVPEEPLCR